MHPILFELPLPGAGPIPIYTWGVLLGLSLIVGWYLTLGLAEKDGLPREMLANCYVVTALGALVTARLLFVVTNLEQFQTLGSVLELRSGGMVAYGGFLGGLAASMIYLRAKGFPLLPWADVAVPSLASGLVLTRIGCYLYGCDFGTRLAESAPGTLQRLGSFPRWQEGPLAAMGSPPFHRHVDLGLVELDATHSLPVHPTQLYEALLGGLLLALLLWLRGRQAFRGQIFLTFAIAYGVGRFLLELVRDDAERGSVPPSLPTHLLYPGALLLLAAAFLAFVRPVIRSRPAGLAFSAALLAPPVLLYTAQKPAEFVAHTSATLSSSQFIGLTSALLACWGYGVLARAAQQHPAQAMAPVSWRDGSEAAKEPEASEAEPDAEGEAVQPGVSRAPERAPAKEAETEAGPAADRSAGEPGKAGAKSKAKRREPRTKQPKARREP